jgi:predicted Zn finger-like uncharacterized protein
MPTVNAALTLTALNLRASTIRNLRIGLPAYSVIMIISCPSCATRYDMPAYQIAADGTLLRCSSCGHSWLESRATEVAAAPPPRQVPAIIEHAPEPDHEIRRLVEASRQAQEDFAAKRRKKRKKLAGWMGFAAAAVAPLAVAFAAPEMVVRTLPVTIRGYELVGQDINIYGLELRKLEMQHMSVDGAKVLAIKGEIANTSGSERKIPWLRFGLKEVAGKEVYRWTLDTASRPLRPGEITNFVTRVAAPPETAKIVEIRFAHAQEIGSNAAP